ncbi:PDZD7 [Acanthosepion pharaonis]|uniref:PDZD7 n=1 Tax=Acanthosepion pharaonis TaxID=158019 RepID=A0A812BB20_ACAPH|nr:PDZD7 [Sepia pharaonis]
MTQSPSPSTMTSPHNTMDRGNYTKPKRRTEEGRFQNAVLRTMANLAGSKEEDAENNPFQMLQKMATVILTKDEIKSIMQYVAEYMERNDVEHLVSRLLGVLNKPEKHLLLNQIRELVSPFDRGRFDSMLSVHENINFQKSDYRERFNEKGERGRRPGLKEEQSLLARVQCRRKQLDAQLELLENLRKIKPKIYKHKEEDLNLITVYVSKNIRTLGISVTGGADCKKQQAIVIEEVHSGGAAAETKRIKPGMILVSVDDEDIEAASHKAAVYTIRKAFTDRKKPYMKLVLRKPADVERWSTS